MHCLLFNVNEQIHQGRPAGAYRIAHVLREHGWDAEVIEYAYHWNLDQLQELARSRITNKTVFLGFSHLFGAWNDTLEQFCAWAKKTWPRLVTISGASVNPMFTSKQINYYVQGYGEHAIIKLLKYITGDGSCPTFNLTASGGRKIIPAIQAYPAYPMSSLMIQYQKRDFILPEEWLTIEFARGCKFACSYCNYPVLGVKDDSSRDAEDFRQQVMHAYDNWGTKHYMVADETFNDRTEKITKFADVVETLPFEPWFSAFIRADLLVSRPQDRIELGRMRALGHFYGIESFNHATAKSIGKGMHPEKLQQGLLDIENYYRFNNIDYRATIALMIGLPYETVTSLQASQQWLLDHWQRQHYLVTVLEIPIGELDKPSKLTETYQKYGYEPMDDVDSDLRHQYGSKLLRWKNPNMDVEQAQKIEQSFIQNKYSGDFYRGSWSLAAFGHLGDIKNILAVKETAPVDRQYHVQLANSYIQKKLNAHGLTN